MARQRPGAAAALPNATDNFIENWAWNGTFSEHFKGAHNIVTTARRPEGPSLRRDGARGGKGCALPLGKKNFKNRCSQVRFQTTFFLHNFCCLSGLENAALEA